ncbi:MAG: hypothetical protein H6738_09495 [Alphaproteobacteria bacterium]|nr:hypothetical protein [Alphaproteobacteria bacterium]
MTTTTFRTVMLATLLAGCQLGTFGEEPTDPGTGTPGLGMPDGCVEDHREPVDDVTDVPEGFDRSAVEVIDELTGTFAGEADGQPIALDVQWDGDEVEAVYRRWSSNGQSEGPPMGAPAATGDEACGPTYAFGVTSELDALPLVAAEGSAELLSTMIGTPYYVAETPIDEVEGTSAPTFDPADWDRTVLAVGGDLHGDTVFVQIMWSGIHDELAPAVPGTATGTAVSTGTVAPSGVVEFVLSAELARVE